MYTPSNWFSIDQVCAIFSPNNEHLKGKSNVNNTVLGDKIEQGKKHEFGIDGYPIYFTLFHLNEELLLLSIFRC